MKRILLAIGLLVAVTTDAAADICAADTLDNYKNLADCMIGTFKFSGFTFDPGNTTIDPKTIKVTPIDTDKKGFSFSELGLSESRRLRNQSITIGFMVEATDTPQMLIAYEKLSMDPTVRDGGVASIQGETIQNQTLSLNKSMNLGTTMTQRSFSPFLKTVTVNDSLKAEVGNVGFASINSFTETFQAAPEPSGIILMASGLIGLALAARGWGPVTTT